MLSRKIWGLLRWDYSQRGKRNAQSLWNPSRIQVFVLAIIYAFRADHLTAKLISPQRFYLYYVQWNLSQAYLVILLVPWNKSDVESEDAAAGKIMLRLSELPLGNWIVVLEKKNDVPISDTPPMGCGTFMQGRNFKSADSRHSQDIHQSGLKTLTIQSCKWSCGEGGMLWTCHIVHVGFSHSDFKGFSDQIFQVTKELWFSFLCVLIITSKVRAMPFTQVNV